MVKQSCTRKRGKAQRVARPACANVNVHFLFTYRLAMLLPPSERPLNNQRTAYYSLRSLTTHANESQVLRVTGPKVHQICSHSSLIFVIDGVNATIRVAIRPPVVK